MQRFISLFTVLQAFFIMLREGDDRDAITGLQAKTHFGRPEWPKIFDSISLAHPK